MPIHSLGYRNWNGPLSSENSRWAVIAGIGIRRAWQSTWLRRIVFFAWVPGVIMAMLIYLFEQAVAEGNPSAFAYSGLADMFLGRSDGDALRQNAAAAARLSQDMVAHRHQFWCSLLQVLYQRSQVVVLIMVVGLTAPALISQDMRSRAFLLYFSRPISRTQYILGKAASIACYVLAVTFLPGITLYVTGVLLSPDISIVVDTWDIPLRVVGATITMAVPTTCLGLMLSSLTTETRFASFAWFSVWIFGLFSNTVTSAFVATGGETPLQMLSLFHVIADVQGWLLDVRPDAEVDVVGPLSVLITVTIVSLAILYKRVSAPMNV
jgi:ABC-2 type transport system permease protein